MNLNVKSFVKKYTMVIALVAVFILFGLLTHGRLLYPQNMSNLLLQNSYVLVLACGMLLCILTGGNIDLSVGSVVCFTASIGCVMMDRGANMWLAVLVMLAIGLAIGVFQGFWIAKIRVPAFIATLSGFYAYRGIASWIMRGESHVGMIDKDSAFIKYFGSYNNSYVSSVLKGWFRALEQSAKDGWIANVEKFFTGENALLKSLLFGVNNTKSFDVISFFIGLASTLIFLALMIRKIIVQKKMGIKQSIPGQIITTVIVSTAILWLSLVLSYYKGFPMVLVWILLVLGVYAYVTNRTAMGRHLYAVGGNEKATALSGIKTRNVYWFAYASIGLMAGLAGILTSARGVGIDPTAGEGYEMDAIASCFIGGASAYGGTGKVSGMIIGALLMGVINKGLMIVAIPINYRVVIKGAVLLIAVMFDVLSKRQKR
jgi:putative multiple sugar transport system permease protein